MLLVDRKLSKLLSEFFLDISKASFIAIFITVPSTDFENIAKLSLILTRYIIGVILFMYMAWIFKEN